MLKRPVFTLRFSLSLWWGAITVFLLDLLAGLIAFAVGLLPELRVHFSSLGDLALFFVGLQLVWSLIFLFGNLYSGEPTTSRLGEVQNVVRVSFSVVVLVVFITSVFPMPVAIRGGIIFKYWILLTILMVPLRLCFRTFQKYLLRRGIGRRRAVILGLNERGIRAEQDILDHNQQGFDVLGFVRGWDDPPFDPPPGVCILGEEGQIKDLIQTHQVSDVVLALEKPEHARVMDTINRINGTPVAIKIVPDLYEVISGLARTQQLYGLPLLDINPNLGTLYNRYFKRLLDVVLGIIGLVIVAPLWAAIAIAIKLDSKGPVLYKQARIGYDNKGFTIYKFRSMIDDAEAQTGPVWATEEDPRITVVGKWLRRFRLDEIPQLLNILKGDMSWVGPRPERPFFVSQLLQEYPFYHRRHRVRPGLSGWAQIKRPYDDDLEDVRQKLKYDFFYIESLCFSLDLVILLNTVWVVLSGKGR